MNRERAKELLPVIQAFADGEDIEAKGLGDWIVTTDATWKAECTYRIKPKPREFWISIEENGHDAWTYKPSNINGEVIKVIEVIE